MSDEEDEKDLFNPKEMMKIHQEIELKKQSKEGRGMFVSGWDDADADEGITEERNPHETPEKEILWAAENGMLDIAKSLISNDRNLLNVVDDDGYTPLHRACYNDHIDMVNLFLSYGASVSTKTKMGWEPLHSACQWNHPNCIARLLAAGAYVNAVSNGDQTPLHIAASSTQCRKMLQILLMNPFVNAQLKNNSNDFPKDIARRRGTYDYLFDMSEPAIDFIKSRAFTENPFIAE